MFISINVITIGQLARGNRKQKKKKYRRLDLEACPQKAGVCKKVHKMTPRKPCSAWRAFTRVLLSNGKIVTCYIPGVGHDLSNHKKVLVHGGRPNDLPGVKYKIIRGGRMEAIPVVGRRTSRSRYGVRNPIRIHK
jgi:small subunit ribosomal protein S12